MTPKRFHRIREVLTRRQLDLTVVLENVHKPHNFAAVLRTADAVGLFEAHAVVPELELRTSLVSASGSDKWVRVTVSSSIEKALENLGGQGLRVLAAHPSKQAVDYRSVDFTQPTAILFGQEKDGLSETALSAAAGAIRVPMAGFVRSLNVSVAAAIILFEAMRQRTAAGLYDESKLEAKLFERTLFEWSYPDLAAHCRLRGAVYPGLDDDGELVDAMPK